jgi:predicted MPP superfamily phosphohydrolase
MLYRIIYLSISVLGFFLHGILIWQIVRIMGWNDLHQLVNTYHDEIWVLFSLGTLSIPAFAIGSYIATKKYYNRLLSWIYTLSVWYLGAGGYLLVASICSWFIAVIFAIHRSITLEIPFTFHTLIVPFSAQFTSLQKILIFLPLVIAGLLVIYGTINAYILRITRYNLSARAGRNHFPSSWIGKKIVVYSDVHTGTIHGSRFLRRIITAVNKENPYVTIMAGDLIDGPKFPHKQLLPLQELRSECGNYFIPGNHEQYSRDRDMPHIIDTYLRRISDDVIIVDGVYLIGIDYRHEPLQHTRETVAQIVSETYTDPTMPIIGILHDPKNIQALLDIVPNLTLSGHTHGGQLWPGNLIVKKVYGILGYGPSHHNQDQTLHITSSGAGTAQTPMRVGTKPEIVVITITE